MSPTLPELSNLSLDQKLNLMDQIWDSIARETPLYPLSDALKQELDRRHEELVRDPSQAISWEQARKEILRDHEDPS